VWKAGRPWLSYNYSPAEVSDDHGGEQGPSGYMFVQRVVNLGVECNHKIEEIVC